MKEVIPTPPAIEVKMDVFVFLCFCDLNCDRNCSGIGCLQALYKSLDVALSNFFAAAEASPIVVRMVDVDVPAPKKREGGGGGGRRRPCTEARRLTWWPAARWPCGWR